jgi:hypothetical protein
VEGRATSPNLLEGGKDGPRAAQAKSRDRERRSRKRGYVSFNLKPEMMTTRMRVVSDPQASVSTLKAFAMESGKPGKAEA